MRLIAGKYGIAGRVDDARSSYVYMYMYMQLSTTSLACVPTFNGLYPSMQARLHVHVDALHSCS